MSDLMKREACAAIDEYADIITSVSDQIWSFAEISLLEYKSSALYCGTLRDLGFDVEERLGGIPTAFSGRFGVGSPVIGILAEFDALAGLSQEAGALEHRPIVDGGGGHGCGHNLLGAGALAAAIAIKRYLENAGGSGTVIFYGCPGEEGVASKAFLAREGLWKSLDAALTWHPGETNEVSSGSCLSSIQKEYIFTGVASHAAAVPHLGRSALDAVELMNVGAQFLREHMPSSARIHYAITDAGGVSPNVVQPLAKVLYMVRDNKVARAIDLLARVDRIAEGAALMTDTRLSTRFVDGTAEIIPNQPLEELLYINFQQVGPPAATPDENAHAEKLRATMPIDRDNPPGDSAKTDPDIASWVREQTNDGQRPYNDFLIPYRFSQYCHMGSTDVGDVSYLTPTAQIRVAAVPASTPGHSWQEVSCGTSSMAHRAVLCAGKVLAGAAIDLLNNPDLLRDARAFFEQRTRDGYHCPIPAGEVAKPQVI